MKKIKILTVSNLQAEYLEKHLDERMNELISLGWNFIPPLINCPLVISASTHSSGGGYVIATFEREE